MAWALAWNLERHSLYPTENRGPGAGSPSSGTSEGRWHEECYSWVNAMHSMIAQASVTAASWRRLTRWAAPPCLALLALGWSFPAHAACPGASFPCDWDLKRKLTFNNSGQAENLVNVPVLVVLNSSRIDYSQTQNAGPGPPLHRLGRHHPPRPRDREMGRGRHLVCLGQGAADRRVLQHRPYLDVLRQPARPRRPEPHRRVEQRLRVGLAPERRSVGDRAADERQHI